MQGLYYEKPGRCGEMRYQCERWCYHERFTLLVHSSHYPPPTLYRHLIQRLPLFSAFITLSTTLTCRKVLRFKQIGHLFMFAFGTSLLHVVILEEVFRRGLSVVNDNCICQRNWNIRSDIFGWKRCRSYTRQLIRKRQRWWRCRI